jgi:hypothetical protein
MQELSMKPFKTALLATAFTLATTMAFAQTGASGSGNAGATVGGTSDYNQFSTGADINARGNKAGADINTSGSTTLKRNKMRNQTTGSGSASNIKANGTLGETNRYGR